MRKMMIRLEIRNSIRGRIDFNMFQYLSIWNKSHIKLGKFVFFNRKRRISAGCPIRYLCGIFKRTDPVEEPLYCHHDCFFLVTSTGGMNVVNTATIPRIQLHNNNDSIINMEVSYTGGTPNHSSHYTWWLAKETTRKMSWVTVSFNYIHLYYCIYNILSASSLNTFKI